MNGISRSGVKIKVHRYGNNIENLIECILIKRDKHVAHDERTTPIDVEGQDSRSQLTDSDELNMT